MHTTFKFQVLYIDAIVTRAPGVERRRVFAIGIVFLDFRLRGALELVTVILQESVDLAIIQHIVLGSVRMENGHRPLRLRCAIHIRSGTGGNSRNLVGNLAYRMVREHAAHRKSRKVDAFGIELVILDQLVNDRRYPFGVLIATDVPGTVSFATLRVGNDETGRIGDSFPVGIGLLVIGVLVGAVQRKQQRAIFGEAGRCVDIDISARNRHLLVITNGFSTATPLGERKRSRS